MSSIRHNFAYKLCLESFKSKGINSFQKPLALILTNEWTFVQMICFTTASRMNEWIFVQRTGWFFKSTVAIKGNFDIRMNAIHIKDSREFFPVISRLHIDEQMNFCSKCTLNLLGKFFSEISLLHIVEWMNFCSKCTLKLLIMSWIRHNFAHVLSPVL